MKQDFNRQSKHGITPLPFIAPIDSSYLRERFYHFILHKYLPHYNRSTIYRTKSKVFSNFRIHIILDGSLQSPLFMNSNIFSTMMPFTAVLMLLCAATLSSGASRPLSNVSHGTILNVEESYRRLRAFHAIAGYRPASSVSDYVRANRGCSTFTLLYPYSQTYFLTISLLRATIRSPLERD